MTIERFESKQSIVVLVGLILIIGLFYILFSFVVKLAGLLLLLVGLWLVVMFPDISNYQHGPFISTARIIGLLMAIIGGLILIFW